MSMLDHALVVTCQAPPRDTPSATHGVYQRFGALLRATAAVARRVTILAAYRTEPGAAPVGQDELQDYYRRYCGVSAEVIKLVIPPPDTGPMSRIETVRRGLADPFHHGHRHRLRALPWLEPVRRLLASGPDVVLAHRLTGFQTLMQLGEVDSPIVLDLDDVEHLAALRMLRFPPHYRGKVLELARPLGLARLERAASRRAAATFVCSERDRRWLERVIGARRVAVLPNSVEAPARPSPTPASRNVLFVGSLNYLPNTQAAALLVRDIWPRILRACPDATLAIAGRGPERVQGSANPHPSVRFLGYVPDLEPFYANAQLVVCPITAGSGTRIKIIEAAMYGRAVVSTPLGAEGLDFRHPDEIRLRRGPARFADECVGLLADAAQCERIGQAALTRATGLYGREAFVGRVEAALRAAAAHTAPALGMPATSSPG